MCKYNIYKYNKYKEDSIPILAPNLYEVLYWSPPTVDRNEIEFLFLVLLLSAK